ncbi:MAG TPA: Hsp20/alpha crystallin family protein [Thermoanaerobaculia bacterium]|nr:Hsp20/alpha crystallin family protein [Thermoanaerobaculia bacterium]
MLEFHDSSLNHEPVHRLANVDLHEDHGDLVLRADLQGLNVGEVEILIDQGELVIEADGWTDAEPGHEHYEHLHGRLPLPFAANAPCLVSHVEDDVLEVRIPIPQTPSIGAADWMNDETLF